MNWAPESGTSPPAFDEAAFLAALAPVLGDLLGGDGRVRVTDRMAGNINLVLKLAYGERVLGARVAVNAHRFRYEAGIVKEVFAGRLLACGGGRPGDASLRRIVDAVLARPVGSLADRHWFRPILWYDWSHRVVPHSFFVFDWVEGEPLWRRPSAERYAQAGRDLAGLHRLAFDHFYEDICAIHRRPLGWAERFHAAWSKELAEAAPRLPAALAGRLAAFDSATLVPGAPCLVHNDYTGGNLLVEPGGRLCPIDWDNWVVDCAELDLVKMRYWTAIGPDGMLGHQPDLYAAFRRGYAEAADRDVDGGRLMAYERLWLLRIFNFESRRGAGPAESWQAVYPPAATYRRHLADLAEQRKDT